MPKKLPAEHNTKIGECRKHSQSVAHASVRQGSMRSREQQGEWGGRTLHAGQGQHPVGVSSADIYPGSTRCEEGVREHSVTDQLVVRKGR